MRILIVSQYYPPDITAAAFRIGGTVSLLRARGHEVQVITTTPHKGKLDQPAGDTVDDGIVRVPTAPQENRSAGGYIQHYVGFAVQAFRAAMRVRKTFDFDVIWATSPPLFVAICVLPLKWLTRRPLVMDIRDIWPESAVNIGKVGRGSLMERLGKVLEVVTYRSADALTCVSRPMREYLLKKGRRPVTIVYNGIDAEEEAAAGGEPDPDAFCYAGNLGYAQGIDTLLRAFAVACRNDEMAAASLTLIGTGAIANGAAELAGELGIGQRVHFRGAMQKRAAMAEMRRAGTLVIPLMDSAAFEITVPSKVFDCMSLGRPILATLRGEGKAILEKTGANVVVPPGEVDTLAQAFVRVRTDWLRLYERAPANARLVGERFTREAAVEQLVRTLDAAVKKDEPAQALGAAETKGRVK